MRSFEVHPDYPTHSQIMYPNDDYICFIFSYFHDKLITIRKPDIPQNACKEFNNDEPPVNIETIKSYKTITCERTASGSKFFCPDLNRYV